MTIGHPDFLAAVSPAPPQLITPLGPYGPGGTWGPVTVQVPSGGAYVLVIFPVTGTQFCCTDVTISHLDSRGIPVYQDFYGGVLCGNALPGVAGNCNAAIIRGNIYGTSLQLSGNAASSAFLNAVIPGHAFTATGPIMNLYSTPFALDDPQPKVTVAAAQVAATTGLTPQSIIAVMNEQVVAANTSTSALPFLSYQGEGVIQVTQAGVAAAGNVQLRVNGWTVANGSGLSVFLRKYQGLVNGVATVFPIDVPPVLHTYVFQNSDPANATTVDMLLSAGKAA